MRNVRLETLLLAVWIVSPNLSNNYSTKKRTEASCFIIHTKKLQTQSQTWICDSKIWPFVESGDMNIDVDGVFQSSLCDDVKLFFISKVVFSVCGSWMQLQKVVSHWWSRISVILFWFNCAGFVFHVHSRATIGNSDHFDCGAFSTKHNLCSRQQQGQPDEDQMSVSCVWMQICTCLRRGKNTGRQFVQRCNSCVVCDSGEMIRICKAQVRILG